MRVLVGLDQLCVHIPDQGQATVSAIHQAFQWALDPDGNAATQDGAKVVDAPFALNAPGCDTTFATDIQTMRAALDDVMTKIPGDQVTPAIKAHMAEFILKAAAEGQTSYDALLAAASNQIHSIVSMLT